MMRTNINNSNHNEQTRPVGRHRVKVALVDVKGADIIERPAMGAIAAAALVGRQLEPEHRLVDGHDRVV